MYLRVVLAGVLLLLLCESWAQHDPQNMVSYEEKFVTGVKKYALENWADTIIYISQAMEEYKDLEAARLKCFRECEDTASKLPSEFPEDTEMEFFFHILSRASCVKRCEEAAVGLLPWGAVSHYVLNQLKKKDGYNYLQMSLYKVWKMRDAARASATFSYFNPHNIQIMRNINFYKSLQDVTEEDLVSMETLEYRELFSEGHRMYYAQNWTTMVEVMEDSLNYFYSALDECRTLCNGPLKYSEFLTFPQTVSKVYLDRLDCRVRCVKELGDFREDRREDFFGAYFHYLQHGYYHLNQSLKAVQASAAHVRLEPENEAAKGNSVFYLRQPGVTKKDFLPSEEVVPEIVKREDDVKTLRLFREVTGHEADGKQEFGEQEESQDLNAKLLEEDFMQYPVGQPSPSTLDALTLVMEDVEPVVVQSSADFGGLERLVVDDLLTQQQCSDLMHLASFGKEGDGYQRKSPHTEKEKFEGLHVLDAAKRSVAGEFSKHLSWLYVNSSRLAKDVVAREFNLATPLYFSYTHLVCRTALEGLQGDRNDLSHPVHSDNCILNEATAECDKVPPAYTWRDYSAILYLSGDIEGGDFFFAHSLQDLSPDVRVKPKCGRLVGFSAGKENLHGVTAVTKGRRCAVALWFTLDPNHKELSFETAAQILQENQN